MADLILQFDPERKPGKDWTLYLRKHECMGEVEWEVIWRGDQLMARDIARAERVEVDGMKP